MPHRCAFGCKATDVVMHVFPDPHKFPERFKIWVNLIGGELETQSHNEYYKKKRICDIHFSNEHKNRFKRLNALAVPSLYLPRKTETLRPGPSVDVQPNLLSSIDVLENIQTLQPGPSVDVQPAAVPSVDETIKIEKTEALQLGPSVDVEPSALPSIDETIKIGIPERTEALQPRSSVDVQPAAQPSVHELDDSNARAAVVKVLAELNYTAISQTRNKTYLKGKTETLRPSPSPSVDIQPNLLPSFDVLENTETLQPGRSVDIQPAAVPSVDIQPNLLPSIDVLENTEILQPGPSVNIQPAAVPCVDETIKTDESNARAAVVKVLAEHNYSAISRTRTKNKGTPGATFCTFKPLQKKIRYLQTEISRLRKKGKSYKDRLANATKLSENAAFQKAVQHMTKPVQLFMHMQQQTIKKPKGRRFTLEEKILSLSLYKKSPKCYRLLQKYFSLPSGKAMKRLLSCIKFNPGKNPLIFQKIKKSMLNKEVPDRLCSLIFDEMSITPQIFYVSEKDQLDGFTSNSGKVDEEIKFADHVLVFMLKGVKNNFKQPIAYYFTNSLKKFQLIKMLKSVIEECLKSGLIIVNTVCDQSPVNVAAVTEMVAETKAMYLRQGKEWRHDVMRIKGHDIVPLYDAPHLLKGLRNNLLTKDLIYVTNNEEKTLKWDYYQMVYNADKSYGELRLLNKLTEEHVNPDKINKMRVKLATQLFSHSMAVVTEHLTARGDVPAECKQLIDFTLLIDNVFDSLNVSSFSIPNGKVFKGPVKRNSPHHELWRKAKDVLKSVKYVKKVKVGDKIRLVETVVPSVTNLMKTLEGMETLWKLLSQKYGVDVMLTRNFNQDPLENFFGNIRSYGVRNIAPNTVAFEGAFKSLLLNNFSVPHSKNANCEEDSSVLHFVL